MSENENKNEDEQKARELEAIYKARELTRIEFQLKELNRNIQALTGVIRLAMRR